MAAESGTPPMDAEAMHQAGLAAAAALPADPAEGTTQAPATPAEGSTAEQAATAPADSFTKLDPSTLPPELRPYYDSFQGDYTRKMQDAAPWRSIGEATGLDPQGMQQAAELYAALQDPQQLVQFYSELTAALEANGLTPAEAAQAATDHIQGAPSMPGTDPTLMDPEEQRIAALEAKLAQFEQQQTAEAEARQREIANMNLVAEMNRQEALVREAYPSWDQTDIDQVYRMAGPGGNLIEAAGVLANYTADKVSRILSGKAAVAGNPANAPLPPAIPGVSKPQSFGADLDAAHRAALEAAKLLP